ncbi:PSD1 and planctomycete cytochrome C domain-containing protein [Echinicola marina]|uniref:PSD1 and planctomycete cytochrome C domain-containing protein n=1 Tax=Echinicola marina TaxID=2859768 RepID=UPI001CF675BC|nr:PSD1 and planctomycete cytochrome C domain-containing protein [Echinicola marina]UCS93906.1 PSD1 and planctomycete cytochrome C domain-containing protein [Echinicola marina]
MRKYLLGFLGLFYAGILGIASCSPGEEKIDFNAEVRPIINSKCITCHGGVKQSGEFSLLFQEEALSPTKSGHPAIIPGDAEGSEMIKRILAQDPEQRMPPEGPALSKEEVDILKRWINQGAEWEDHWSFVAPEKPDVPEVDKEAWNNNPIDHFILKKMEEKGLSPSPQADAPTLARRLSLDIIGLPPSEEMIQSLESDPSLKNYERIVDELLGSPQYGEKWTSMWLDLARYADSKGYEKDAHRDMWKYRDWVIKAFNQDMPFDQFTIEQLAGDLLPEPSKDQLIASGFHRNTMTNDEGGTDDEEFRVAAVLDRVNTTWEVWQGITFACVQCHSHPYEPIKHEEYFEFYAFLNNTADKDHPSDSPILPVYTEIDLAKKAALTHWIDSVKNHSSPYRLASMIEEKENELEKIRQYRLPIMQELPEEEQRSTFVFERGNWTTHGKQVYPGVPGSLPNLPEGVPANRLGMAKWLVSGENPLTARVTVNRIWGRLFGKGIVETQEDFGSQGAAPTHPELLDWLAIEWMEKDQWHLKALIKRIVMTATYRQSSEVSPKALEIDAANDYLSRAPRVRLSAEQVRDQALAVSGLLSDKMYGPSVMPYQPEGIWQAVYNGSSWDLSEGEDQHRRAVYTYLRRTSPYPSMIAFDGPTREFCVNRRIDTNTPLQALVTLNDAVYVEAAQALAKKMKTAGSTAQEQITKGYEKALLLSPSEKDMEILMNLYTNAKSHFDQTGEGLENMDKTITDPELNALTVVANAIMNLDNFITRN